jgi:hypothetical protein
VHLYFFFSFFVLISITEIFTSVCSSPPHASRSGAAASVLSAMIGQLSLAHMAAAAGAIDPQDLASPSVPIDSHDNDDDDEDIDGNDGRGDTGRLVAASGPPA